MTMLDREPCYIKFTNQLQVNFGFESPPAVYTENPNQKLV